MKIIKMLTFCLISLSLNANAFVFDESTNELEIIRTKKEVIINSDGSEFTYRTTTIKPNMKIEEDVVVKNKTKKNYKYFDYRFNISEGLTYDDYKNKDSKLDIEYSSNGKDYHKELNKENDLYIKVRINDIKANEERNFKIRYNHKTFDF